MAKQLILFRHGKSDWSTDFSRDHQRPVAQRGIQAAQMMGRWLAATDQVPDGIITSSAVRALTTVQLAAEAGQWQVPLRVRDDLYEASIDQVLRVIHQEPELHQSLLLIGHEPTWSDTASYLIGGGTVKVPTAAMVCLDLEVDIWPQVAYGSGSLRWLLPPKLLAKSKFR